MLESGAVSEIRVFLRGGDGGGGGGAGTSILSLLLLTSVFRAYRKRLFWGTICFASELILRPWIS